MLTHRCLIALAATLLVLASCATVTLKDEGVRPPPDFARAPATEGVLADMARLMERDMSPANAWQVLLDDNGDLYWVNRVEKMESQPARGSSQRVMDAIFKIFPKDQF
jgi:hypothetical protein